MRPSDLSKENKEKQIRRQRERIIVLGFASLSYAVDTLWLSLFFIQGIVNIWVPFVYGISGGIACGIIYLIFKSRLNLGLKDKNLMIAQMSAGYTIQLFFLYFVPQLAFLFLLTLFIVSAFGILVMSVRQFVIGWSLVAAATGFIFLVLNEEINFSLATKSQRVVLWLAFVSILARVIFIGMRVSGLRNQFNRQNRQLEQSLQQIEILANVDGLTQVLNRRAFMKIAEEEMLRSTRNKNQFCLALIDIDHFKQINDKFGHLVGDEVLKVFAVIVGDSIRATDKLARYGGEEFILLLPETKIEGGRQLMDRILNKIHNTDWQMVSAETKITASIGLVAFSIGEPLEKLIERSDIALYKAKNAGRDCIIFN